MEFETEAYINEYVINGENTGKFTGNETSITYTPVNTELWDAISIPTENITNIRFERSTALIRNRFLGWFFAILTGLMIIITYGEFFHGQIMNPELNGVAFFMFFLIIGGISTTYEYFKDENYDVILIHIETNAESHIFTGRIKNTEFVEACGELIESDLETINQNEKLRSELNN